MKKICLTVVGLYILFFHAQAQFRAKDTSSYKQRPLAIEEVNLVSSYYSQDGNHSAVTGGIGTEKVTDFANGLELKFVGYDARQRKNSLSLNLGIDHHTAASSAHVNTSGASKTGGTRIYPGINWSIENEQKGTGLSLGAYYSGEYNYKSIGLDAAFSKKTNNNGEFNFKLSGYFDRVKQIYPSELIPASSTTSTGVTVTTASGNTVLGGRNHGGENSIPSLPRNTLTASVGFSQVINTQLQASLLLDLAYQNGDLGLPFHRVYWNDGSVHIEQLPSQRLKIPAGLRVNYFLGDHFILRSYYRFYTDNWGLTAHTAGLEMPIKLTPFLSLSPFYRYYTQTAVKYFAAYGKATAADTYYTSNYALSAFNSHFFGMGFRTAPPAGIAGPLKSVEIRFGHYTQTTDLVANVLSLALQFK